MTENSNVRVITVAAWQDELGSLLQAKEYIGKSPVYLTQGCYDSLKRQIAPNGELKAVSCKSTMYEGTIYCLEKLVALGFEFHSCNGHTECEIFIFKKPKEKLRKYGN